ncbi:MAG TPA: DUF2779 domain-containing protein [Candidatus Limnocylindrales bacterium]|nr:DUF2779 domain-containing protein [Candidatus Limnocylindrales bacterium]
MLLSKSEYMMFLKHPAWLWLKKHDKAKLPIIDDNTQAVFDAGHLFETYAEQLFPEGVRLGFDDYYEYLSLPERTQRAIKEGAKTIFQGRFEHSQLTFVCDVIQIVDEKTVDLYEIKSSTKVKLEHELDLAFQMIVLELCGNTVRNISVIHVNNEYIKRGDIVPGEFTTIVDITENVKAKRKFTEDNIKAALKVANSEVMPDISPSLAAYGSLKEWLGIYRGLVSVEPESIYDLCVLNTKLLSKFDELKVKKLNEIPSDFPLSGKQKQQVESVKQNRVLIEKEKIRDFLSSLIYPLYFLDYETLGGIVPYFDDLRAYQQLPFQYSLDVLETPDSEIRHFEYLHSDNSNPAEEISKNLKSQIGTTGSILAWSAGFEKSCNTLLGTILTEYKEFYEEVNNRIVDLMIPFSSSWYVDKGFGGSASIKAVLPVLAPELSYKTLGIQEGASAQRLWMEAILYGERNAEKEQILDDLIKYCGLDTLAMVEIYKHLVKLKQS